MLAILARQSNITFDKEFTVNNTSIDPNNETAMSSYFQYFDLNLKNKILALYERHKPVIDAVRQTWEKCLPEMNVGSIGQFVKIRNTKEYIGKIVWGGDGDQYPALFALVYACIFSRAGIPDNELTGILSRIF
jgi:hypothetical protein